MAVAAPRPFTAEDLHGITTSQVRAVGRAGTGPDVGTDADTVGGTIDRADRHALACSDDDTERHPQRRALEIAHVDPVRGARARADECPERDAYGLPVENAVGGAEQGTFCVAVRDAVRGAIALAQSNTYDDAHHSMRLVGPPLRRLVLLRERRRRRGYW